MFLHERALLLTFFCILIFGSSISVRAQEAKVCPAEVVRVVPSYTQHSFYHCDHIRQCDAVEIRNNSNKKIVGAKIHMVYYDAVGDPKDNGIDYTSDGKLNPNKKSLYVWKTRFLVDDSSQGATAWVMKVLFDDGSTWEDDGTKACSAKSRK